MSSKARRILYFRLRVGFSSTCSWVTRLPLGHDKHVLTVIQPRSTTMDTSRQSSSIFVRQSSGLVREASVLDALIFNAVFSAPVGATLAFGIFYALGTSPGADIVLALVIAFLVNIPVCIMMKTGMFTRNAITRAS